MKDYDPINLLVTKICFEATVTFAYETKRAAYISARQAGLITDYMYHDMG